MAATPQERLALGVAALLLAGGATARVIRTDPPVSALTNPPSVEASASRLAAQVEDSVARAERRRTPLAAGERLDPNTADADELDRLPRVGPALAARIVEWRQARGPFRTLADLDSVPGVGPALLANVAPHLTLPAAPAAPSDRAPARKSSQSAASVADWANPAKSAAPARPAGATVDLNTATAEELAALPGIGPALARRVVEWRAANGRFRGVDQLVEVPGIGPAKLERLRPLVRATP